MCLVESKSYPATARIQSSDKFGELPLLCQTIIMTFWQSMTWHTMSLLSEKTSIIIPWFTNDHQAQNLQAMTNNNWTRERSEWTETGALLLVNIPKLHTQAQVTPPSLDAKNIWDEMLFSSSIFFQNLSFLSGLKDNPDNDLEWLECPYGDWGIINGDYIFINETLIAGAIRIWVLTRNDAADFVCNSPQ